MKKNILSPIRFDPNYLGCIKATILDDCKQGGKATLKGVLIIETDNDDNNENDYLDSYEGYFRLMTSGGLPFVTFFIFKSKLKTKKNR